MVDDEAGSGRVGLLERLRRRGPERMRRLSPDAWTTMLVVIGVVGGLALGFLLGSIPGALDRAVTPVARPVPTTAPVPTVTVTTTYVVPPSPPALAARRWPEAGPSEEPSGAESSAPAEGSHPGVRTHWETGGIGGDYGHVGTLTESTTQGFARNVARAYNASGAGGRTKRVTATSDATGRRITMTCSPRSNGSVVCRGGRNARVVLWR